MPEQLQNTYLAMVSSLKSMKDYYKDNPSADLRKGIKELEARLNAIDEQFNSLSVETYEVSPEAFPKDSGLGAEIDYFDQLKHDFVFFCQEMLLIKYRPGVNPKFPKGGSGPLILSPAQVMIAAVLMEALANDVFLSLVILKARQLGITTVLEAFVLFLLVTTRDRHYMLIIDKDDHMVTKRQQMIDWIEACHNKYPDLFPEIVKREGRVIFLSNGCQLHFESAQSGNPGTSEMLHILHMSEKAKWVAGRAASVDQSVAPAVPRQGGYFIFDESTPLALDEFYRKFIRAKRGESEDIPIFLPWFLSPEYAVYDPLYSPDDTDTELQDSYFDEILNKEVLLTESQYQIRYNLTNAQMAWRRHAIKTDFKGKRREFDKEYPTTPEHAWRSSVAGFYPNDLRMKMRAFKRAPSWVGHITCKNPDVERPDFYATYRPQFVDDSVNGTVKIFSRPMSGRTYYVGGDVAEGKIIIDEDNQPDRDSTVFRVKDEEGNLCAFFESKEPAEHCWLPLLLLSLYYNEAYINVELNGPGKTLWAFFKITSYPNLMVQPGEGPLDGRVWTRVTQANRLTILTTHRGSVISNPACCPDDEFQDQTEYFGQKPGSRVAAPQGMGRHDDHIFADAHAESCRLWHMGFDIRRPVVEDPMPKEEEKPFEGYKLRDLFDPQDEEWENPWA